MLALFHSQIYRLSTGLSADVGGIKVPSSLLALFHSEVYDQVVGCKCSRDLRLFNCKVWVLELQY